jgi:general secretion pathway protein G
MRHEFRFSAAWSKVPTTPPPMTARSPRRPAADRAFTLIELLTVIAIIGVLAAIIISVVGNVRSAARDSRCKSNLRQIGMAIQLHAQENRGLVVASQPNWATTLQPYLHRNTTAANQQIRDVFDCPATDKLSAGGNFSDYGKNSFINPNVPGPASPENWRVRLNTINQPGKVIAVADSTTRELLNNQGDDFGLDFRHGGKANIVFFDGHVAARSRAEIFGTAENPIPLGSGPPWRHR